VPCRVWSSSSGSIRHRKGRNGLAGGEVRRQADGASCFGGAAPGRVCLAEVVHGVATQFGDTYGVIYAFTADGFTQRELRDYVEGARTRLLAINDVSKIDIFGAQDEKIYIEFSTHKLAGLHLDRQALIQAIQAQNAVTPAGVVQTSDEEIRVDVTGGFRSEADLRNVNFVANGQIFRLSDIATIKRSCSDAAADVPL
jgi:multidrug efflux pump